MLDEVKNAFSSTRPIKVYALVGKSGTGKSYRSQMIAAKYRINLIIDDGLLIKNDKLLAGRTAKKEDNFITAMKNALFRDETHRFEVIEAMKKVKFHKILIIGTSEKMVNVIAQRLLLPEPERIFKIEDFASQEEIEQALRSRYTEGKHIIPVPMIEITRTSPDIVYDSVSLTKRSIFRGKTKSYQRTLVKPGFSIPEKTPLSKNAFSQMISQCLYDYDSTIKLSDLEVKTDELSYSLSITLRSPDHIEASLIPEIREYIVDSLERYSSIQIENATVTVDEWDGNTVIENLSDMNTEIERFQGINITASKPVE